MTDDNHWVIPKPGEKFFLGFVLAITIMLTLTVYVNIEGHFEYREKIGEYQKTLESHKIAIEKLRDFNDGLCEILNKHNDIEDLPIDCTYKEKKK